MKNIKQAVWVETLKARRSKMPLITTLGFLMVPFVGGFFMIILKDPEFARRAGLISAKAQLMAGEATWPAFLNMLAQGIAIGGIFLFGFIAIWVFGREYADRTVKDLLALPTSRSTVVLAKFVTILVWSAAVSVVVYIAGMGVGMTLGLPQASSELFWQGSVTIAVCAALTITLVTPIAFFASAGRGYLPPMGVTILAIFVAQIVAVAGWGEYFPWSIPALISQGNQLEFVSYLIVILTGAAGLVGTFVWWNSADQT